MPPASKLGDMVIHPVHTPAAIVNGSTNVLINNIPAATVGSSVSVHCALYHPYPCHPSAISKGSSTVLVNGKPLARLGDSAGCGGVIINGSGNVISG